MRKIQIRAYVFDIDNDDDRDRIWALMRKDLLSQAELEQAVKRWGIEWPW